MRLRTCLASIATCLYLASAQADTISPEPEPGLWRRESTTLVNGQDLQVAIRDAQQQMLQTLPAEQRQMMEEMMNLGGEPGVEMECISPQMAADLTDPEALLQRARDDEALLQRARDGMDECSLTINKVSGSTMAIAGSCAGNQGYAGEMQGELTIVSAREMRSTFSGTGTKQMDAGQTPPALQGMAGDQPVAIEHTEVSTWLSADCGDLEPPE